MLTVIVSLCTASPGRLARDGGPRRRRGRRLDRRSGRRRRARHPGASPTRPPRARGCRRSEVGPSRAVRVEERCSRGAFLRGRRAGSRVPPVRLAAIAEQLEGLGRRAVVGAGEERAAGRARDPGGSAHCRASLGCGSLPTRRRAAARRGAAGSSDTPRRRGRAAPHHTGPRDRVRISMRFGRPSATSAAAWKSPNLVGGSDAVDASPSAEASTAAMLSSPASLVPEMLASGSPHLRRGPLRTLLAVVVVGAAVVVVAVDGKTRPGRRRATSARRSSAASATAISRGSRGRRGARGEQQRDRIRSAPPRRRWSGESPYASAALAEAPCASSVETALCMPPSPPRRPRSSLTRAACSGRRVRQQRRHRVGVGGAITSAVSPAECASTTSAAAAADVENPHAADAIDGVGSRRAQTHWR